MPVDLAGSADPVRHAHGYEVTTEVLRATLDYSGDGIATARHHLQISLWDASTFSSVPESGRLRFCIQIDVVGESLLRPAALRLYSSRYGSSLDVTQKKGVNVICSPRLRTFHLALTRQARTMARLKRKHRLRGGFTMSPSAPHAKRGDRRPPEFPRPKSPCPFVFFRD